MLKKAIGTFIGLYMVKYVVAGTIGIYIPDIIIWGIVAYQCIDFGQVENFSKEFLNDVKEGIKEEQK